MGKFDGMDPKLVRDLLTEVKHAATQMRTVEDQVRSAMHRAGLSTQTTHRPVQVAESVDAMVKDVNVRLGELEKRVEPPRMGAGATEDDDPKQVRGDRDKYDNPRADEPPSKGDDTKPDSDGKTGADGKSDSDGKTGADGKSDSDGKTGADGKSDSDGKTGADGKSGSDADGKSCDGAKDTGTGQDTGSDGKTGDQPVDQPKDDDVGSRRDRGAEADGGAVNTPAKDQQDPTKPHIVEVDGVKVLQIPIDPPTAEQLENILDNADKVQPAEMPKVPADSTAAANINAWANDGSDVVSADTTPPNLDALKTVVGHHREIPPLDMPGLADTSGYDTSPTDAATPADGTASTAGTNDASASSGTDTTPGAKDTTPDQPSGGDSGQRTGGDQPTGDRGTGDQGRGTGDQGTYGQGGQGGQGDQGTRDQGGQGVGDQRSHGAGTGGQGGQGRDGGPATGDQGARGQGAPVAIPPTNPSVQVQIAYGTEAAYPAGSDINAWANDGSDVVSVNASPPSLDALRTVVEHHREIQPLDMPSVEVPSGEYGKGEWAPRDIRPDGPPGGIDPGTPERSA